MGYIIKVKSSIRLNDIDGFYAVLYKQAAKKEKIDILLPKMISKSFFSVNTSLIQFVATWLRSGCANKLIVDIESDNQDLMNRLYEQEFIFPVLALCWNDVSIEDINGKELRHLLRTYQNQFTLRMRRLEAMKGDKLLFANFDHFDNLSGVLPFFENSFGFVVNEEDLGDRLKAPILSEVLKYSKAGMKDFMSVYNDIVGIVYELMKNTYEWGKEDEFKRPMSPSARGMYLKFHKRTRGVVLDEYKAESSIIDFFDKSDVVKSNSLDQVYFVELSVFDTGAGFIRKFFSEDKQRLSDVQIIKRCLIKNQTSATGLLKSQKGIGLDRILRILNNKGLVRIRTDKYCLFRNLITHPYRQVESGDYDRMELFDWKTGSNVDYSAVENCSGSNISILYPLPQY